MLTVLIPPILNYGFLRQLPQQIASQFAKNGYKVYFCNVNVVPNKKMEQVEPNLFVIYDYNKLINQIQNKIIKIDILYTTWAKTYDWVDIVKPKITIYHSCDLFSQWHEYEPKMLSKADIVCCTAKSIYGIRSKQHDNVYLVRNACNKEMIDCTWTKPNDINFDNNVRGLFCGAIGTWVSTYLIKKVADKYPIYLVGKEFGKSMPSNIINLGTKSHDELVNYYHSCTFGLLPFNTKTEITIGANPIKLWEYLACGIPVLATSWDETELPELKGLVFTSKTDEEFYNNADLLANMSEQELKDISIKAKEVASNNTWDIRFNQINSAISDFASKKGISL